jgi:thiamine biosynthesis protein ThiS
VIGIQLNGEPHELTEGTTVVELLESLGLRPEVCAVEGDRELVPRSERSTRVLLDGQHVEVVTLVGGG